ncbi:MAG: hypothetical protein R2710_08070 [Acidimicrobiales bacterium]
MIEGYTLSKAYASSKLANILFTAVDRRLGPQGVMGANASSRRRRHQLARAPVAPAGWASLRRCSPLLASLEKGAATMRISLPLLGRTRRRLLYRSSSKPKQPSQLALDHAAARRLWEVSAELVGLE